LKTNVTFQNEEDPKRIFYFDTYDSYQARLNQLVKRDNNYFLSFSIQDYHPVELYVYNESGVQINKLKIFSRFAKDLNSNIIVNNKKKNLIEYYDLNKDLFKTVLYNRQKHDKFKQK